MEGINLSDFIGSTLASIANGVRSANAALKVEGVDTTDWFSIGGGGKVSVVAFDVAISAARVQRDKAGFGVALAVIGAGAKTEKDHEVEAAHRIRFDVVIRHERV